MNSSSRRSSIPVPSILGAAAWLGAAAIVQPGWAGALLLLAPLIAMPFALALFGVAAPLRWLFFGGAVLLVPAYAVERGPVAAAFVGPWLTLCVGLAIHELYRWPIRREPARILNAGYLAVGAGWLVMARLGLRPLGFEDVIVHATAVHFHYAGFVLPVLLRRLSQADQSNATRGALAGILVGVPLVAAGITLTVWKHRWLETSATFFLASSCWSAAWQQGRFGLSHVSRRTKLLFLVSSFALAVAMMLACLYALGQLLATEWLDIPFMLRFHGSLQVFGFALPALAGWWLHSSDQS